MGRSGLSDSARKQAGIDNATVAAAPVFKASRRVIEPSNIFCSREFEIIVIIARFLPMSMHLTN
jgi:hypothetical protein